MSHLKPSDHRLLAAAAADSLVVSADPYSRHASIFYWERSRPYVTAVVDAVAEAGEPVASLGERLLADPVAPEPYFAFRQALVEHAGLRPAVDKVLDLAWRAECNSRLGFLVGQKYVPDTSPVTVDELLARVPSQQRTAPPDPPAAEVLVVIPFRDRDTGGQRLRNLLACVQALRDQTFPSDAYQVLVVETDDQPRWREPLSRFADHYLFAPNPGVFNKSWAVNVGVVNAPGQAEVIGILDADVLADREFVDRNVARFRRPGTMGHLTYRNMLCLDPPATAWAIRERLHRGVPAADPDHLRGFTLRRPPGCCLWVRSSAFHRIGGMDERFEGWGGEDNDFAYRFDINNALDHYDDWLLHMYHPASATLGPDGDIVNAHIPALTWRPGEPIGRIDRFAAATGGADRVAAGPGRPRPAPPATEHAQDPDASARAGPGGRSGRAGSAV